MEQRRERERETDEVGEERQDTGCFFNFLCTSKFSLPRVLVQYKHPFQELISIGCASLRTYTRYHMSD